MTTTPIRTTPRPGLFAIDPSTSSVTFTTRHLFGLGRVQGSFAVRGGTVAVVEPPAGSTVRAEVDAASFHTGHGARDTTVRSARLLDTDRHPVIVFVSDQVSATEVTGTLTVRGETAPVRLTVTDLTTAPDGEAFNMRATTGIDRTAFGVTALRGLAGRHLHLVLDITCVGTRTPAESPDAGRSGR